MQAHRLTHELVPHPAHPASEISAVTARVDASDPNWLQLRWRIEGTGALSVPSPAGRRRADGLWQTTCFELFLKPTGGGGYVEFNLSPSERWNAYKFDGYREGMREYPVPHPPTCTMRPSGRFAIFDAAIARIGLPLANCAIGLSAVIEEQGGTKSFWAIAHPHGGKPDFHDTACFAVPLEAPARS